MLSPPGVSPRHLDVQLISKISGIYLGLDCVGDPKAYIAEKYKPLGFGRPLLHRVKCSRSKQYICPLAQDVQYA